jgi:ubiquitin C-terminal hydrolase
VDYLPNDEDVALPSEYLYGFCDEEEETADSDYRPEEEDTFDLDELPEEEDRPELSVPPYDGPPADVLTDSGCHLDDEDDLPEPPDLPEDETGPQCGNAAEASLTEDVGPPASEGPLGGSVRRDDEVEEDGPEARFPQDKAVEEGGFVVEDKDLPDDEKDGPEARVPPQAEEVEEEDDAFEEGYPATSPSADPHRPSWAEKVLSKSPLLKETEESIRSRPRAPVCGTDSPDLIYAPPWENCQDVEAVPGPVPNRGPGMGRSKATRNGAPARNPDAPRTPDSPGVQSAGREPVSRDTAPRRNPPRQSPSIDPLAGRLAVPLVAPPYQPRAFPNYGATCYVNAVLQCLFSVAPLREFLRSPVAQQYITTFRPVLLTSFVTLLYGSDRSDVLRTLWGLPGLLPIVQRVKFTRRRQEDANDFLRVMLDRLDAELRPIAVGPLGFDPFPTTGSGPDDPQTILGQLFGGVYTQRAACEHGHERELRDNAFTTLLLNLPYEQTESRSLEDLIDHFLHPPPIPEGDAPLCNVCRFYVATTRALAVSHAPPVLILQIGRFLDDRRIPTPVELPETLILAPHPGDPPVRTVKYHLLACVDHLTQRPTSLDSGHFVTHVRCGSTWFYCNDDEITLEPSIPHFSAPSPDVFLAFYELSDDT